MKVSILAVGTELLFGQVTNTNATFLSRNLNLMGFDVMYHYVVGDNPKRLIEKLDEAFADTDIVILTGGLGPTQDDLTKEKVAEYMDAGMHEDKKVRGFLREYASRRGGHIAQNNMKQALLPDGCVPFYNEAGTAPGFALENDGKIAICLPGPPREMTWLFENCVRTYLEQFVEDRLYYRIVRTLGIGESDLETLLMPLIDGQTDPTIATYVKEGECTIRVTSKRKTIEEAEQAVNDMLAEIDKHIGKYIYSTDDEDINEVLVHTLKEKKLHISAAESCTGGLFASAITDVAGASDVFLYSYVTYSESAKISAIGVPAELIDEFGVSSSEVAVAMAEGARKASGADIAISITGNAGPDSYSGQDAGFAFIGYSYNGTSGYITVDTHIGSRKLNRNIFKLTMLRTAYLLITDKFEK